MAVHALAMLVTEISGFRRSLTTDTVGYKIVGANMQLTWPLDSYAARLCFICQTAAARANPKQLHSFDV